MLHCTYEQTVKFHNFSSSPFLLDGFRGCFWSDGMNKDFNTVLDEALSKIKGEDPYIFLNGIPEAKQAITAAVQIEIEKAKREERSRLTHQAIDGYITSEEAFKIEFELKIHGESEHKYVFAADKDHYEVAVDGQNVISRGSQLLSQKGDTSND